MYNNNCAEFIQFIDYNNIDVSKIKSFEFEIFESYNNAINVGKSNLKRNSNSFKLF